MTGAEEQALIDTPVSDLLTDPAKRDRAVHILLHRLWGKGHDGPNYVKKEWGTLQNLIDALVAAADPPCPRCDERHQQQGEADDGMTNAAEIAGLQ
jgi:hypothetical protein